MRLSAENVRRVVEFARRGRVVVVDTETTGCSRWDEICQIASAEFVNGTLVRTASEYVLPTCEMTPGAEAVHGLSMDFLRLRGSDPAAAMGRFFEFLGEDALFVAHNVPFDRGMIERECAKFGLPCPLRGVETCCTLALSRRLHPELASHALGRLLGPLGVEDAVNSHDALDDVMACAGVFFRLVSELEAGLADGGASS